MRHSTFQMQSNRSQIFVFFQIRTNQPIRIRASIWPFFPGLSHVIITFSFFLLLPFFILSRIFYWNGSWQLLQVFNATSLLCSCCWHFLISFFLSLHFYSIHRLSRVTVKITIQYVSREQNRHSSQQSNSETCKTSSQ